MRRGWWWILSVLLVTLAGCSGSFDGQTGADGSVEGAVDASDEDVVIIIVNRDTGAANDATPSDTGPEDVTTHEAGEAGTVADTGVSEAGCTGLVCSGQCVANDVHNCGTCGNDCTALPHVSGPVSCSAGQCSFPPSSCAPGWTHCSANVAQGCETNESSTSNCGACGVVCPSTAPVCSGSGSSYLCVTGCPPATPTLCSGSCVDATSNPNDCKTCGSVCATTVAHAQPTCVSSACTFSCNSGYMPCSGGCVDETSDPSNCGGCGKSCPVPTGSGSATCAASQCGYSCNLGYHLCGTACADNTSASSCGQACTPCSLPNAVPVCASGACAIGQCTAPYKDCNGMASDGCEANTNTDASHCGSCNACNLPNATAACNGGTCAVAQCNSGNGDCNNNPTDGCETNILGSDANNCGACGHGCLGGTCVAGQCQPVPLATAQPHPGEIVVTNGVVYWVNQGTTNPLPGTPGAVMSAHTDGTMQQTLSSHYEVDALSYDATTLYFSGYDHDTLGYKVFKVLMTGGPTTILVKNRSNPIHGVANDGAYVYWTEAQGGTVSHASKADGSSLLNLVSGLQYPYAIAAPPAGLFWACTGDLNTQMNGAVWRSNQDGSGAVRFGVPTQTPGAMVSSFTFDAAGNVFYQTFAEGIWRVGANGSGNSQFNAQGGDLYVNLTTDSANVYWVGGGQTLYYEGLDGAHRRSNDVLLGNQTGLAGLAVDANYVYFTTSGSGTNNYLDGAVYKVAK